MKFKPAKYGCGGKVIKSYQDGGKVKSSYGAELDKAQAKSDAKRKKNPPKMEGMAKDLPLGSGLAKNAANELQNRRKNQMKDLGLKDGGKAKMKPPLKGKKPKKIKPKYPPGGPMTPGARGTYPPKKRK